MKRPALLAALALATSARAESPLDGSFQFQLGNYRPNIDAEFGGSATPYQDIFGTGRGLVFKAAVAKSLFTSYGTLDLGVGAGWFSRSGKGLVATPGPLFGQPSGDRTQLRILPLSVNLTYRMDWLVSHGGFPLVPYARLSFERWQWWVSNGSGSTATAVNGGPSGQGTTQGWSGALGLAFLLDFLDPGMGREMDRDIGINHTYLFLEGARTKVDDFGSKKSWDLSDEKKLAWSGGILFVF